MVTTPPRSPRPPQPDELEALIKEARTRKRRRRIRIALLISIAVGAGVGVYALVTGGGPARHATAGSGSAPAAARRCPPGNLGTLAFLRGSALALLDLSGCRTRVLVPSRAAHRWSDELPIWSGDGRWILFVRTKMIYSRPAGHGNSVLYALDPFG